MKMTGLLNRPSNWLLFLKKNIQVFIPTPTLGSKTKHIYCIEVSADIADTNK